MPVEGACVLNQLIHRHVIAGSCMYMYTLCTPQQPSASAAGSRSPDPGDVRREAAPYSLGWTSGEVTRK